MNPILPSMSADFEFLSSKIIPASPDNDIKQQVEYKFKWKGHKYIIKWENPDSKKNISNEDKTKYIDKQIDKIVLLAERYLYQNNNDRSLKCSLDLKEVTRIDDGVGGAKPTLIKNPFNFSDHIEALSKDRDNCGNAKESADKKMAIEQEIYHASRAAELQKEVVKITPQIMSQTSELKPLGDLSIVKKDDERIQISYGPLGFIWKLIVDYIYTPIKDLFFKILDWFNKKGDTPSDAPKKDDPVPSQKNTEVRN